MRAAAIPSWPLFDVSGSVSRTGRPQSKQPKIIAVVRPAQNTYEHRNRIIPGQIISQLRTSAAFQFHPGRNNAGEARVASSRSPARESARRRLWCRSGRESPQRAPQSAHEIDPLPQHAKLPPQNSLSKRPTTRRPFLRTPTSGRSTRILWQRYPSRPSYRESASEIRGDKHPAALYERSPVAARRA